MSPWTEIGAEIGEALLWALEWLVRVYIGLCMLGALAIAAVFCFPFLALELIEKAFEPEYPDWPEWR